MARCSFSHVLFVLVVATCVLAYDIDAFDCPALPAHEPLNVRDLRPNNIRLVMALGDSITAGFGIKGIVGTVNEFRGLSWSIGGDAGAVTLPGFLRQYNPYLNGAAKGHHLLEMCGDKGCPTPSFPNVDICNAAQSGAQVRDLDKELTYAIKQAKNITGVNFEKDWKILTVWVGANDVCGVCVGENSQTKSPDRFEATLMKVLERVRAEVPRVFVNLIPTFNVSQVYDLNQKSSFCKNIHVALADLCPCMFKNKTAEARQMMDEYTIQYNARLEKIAEYYQRKKFDDFVAVVQPFNVNTKIRDQSVDFLCTVDCFHPSLKAHQTFAIALWNNMLTPRAQKLREIVPGSKPLCPTPDTLFYTY